MDKPKLTVEQWVQLIKDCKNEFDVFNLYQTFLRNRKFYPVGDIIGQIEPAFIEKRQEFKPKPTETEINKAIAVLNAAGGFQIIRKIDSPKDIIY